MSDTPDSSASATTESKEQCVESPAQSVAWPPAPAANVDQSSFSPPLAKLYHSPVWPARLTSGILALIVACDAAYIFILVLIITGTWLSSLAPRLASICLLCSMFLFVLNIPLFLTWLYRCSKNLSAFGAQELLSTPSQAVVYFFIPIINLYQPYIAVNDIWKASDPKLPLPVEAAWKNGRSSAVVGLWWVIWLIQALPWIFLSNVESPSSGNPSDTIGDGNAITLLNAIAGLLAILVVRTITRRQEEAARQLSAG